MPAFLAPLIIAGLGAAGGAFSGRKGARTGSTSSSGESTREPILSPEFEELLNSLLNENQNPETFRGIFQNIDQLENAGLQDINSLSERIARQITNRNRSQGLDFSSSGNLAEGFAGQARTGALSNLLSQIGQLRIGTQLQIPQIQSQIRARDRSSGASLLRSIPVGQRTQFSQEGENIQPGSSFGTGFTKVADQLANLEGQGVLDFLRPPEIRQS